MTTSPAALQELSAVGTIVDARIADLQTRYLNTHRQESAAIAALARLRRGAGTEPGDVLHILEYTLSPQFRPGVDGDPSADERAAHLAMTLYAVHQQSKSERMHRRGRGLGAALRSLHDGDPQKLPVPLVSRFRMLGTADSFPELAHHLRGVVQLLRAGSVGLDYGRLADQLVTWQIGRRDTVQLDWGRQFYRTRRTSSGDDQTTDTPA